jgi:uncharacterized protein
MKISNKTIDYKLKATDENGKLQLIDDSADMQLPSVERQSDTLKGAGILGEVDLPGYGISSMTFSVNFKADNGKYAVLSRPGEIKIEIVWVNDVFDSAQNKMVIQSNKIFMTVLNKKYDPGKIEVGSSADGSVEFEVLSFRKIINGKEVLLIDKFNQKYVVNGKDYMEAIRTALQ